MCAFLPGGLFSGARGKDGQPGWCVPWEWSRKGRSSWEIVPCFWRAFSSQAMVLFKTLLHKSQALCWGNKLEPGPQGTPVAWPTALSCSPENVAWCKQHLVQTAQSNPFLLRLFCWLTAQGTPELGIFLSQQIHRIFQSSAKENMFTSAGWRRDDAYGEVKLLAVCLSAEMWLTGFLREIGSKCKNSQLVVLLSVFLPC